VNKQLGNLNRNAMDVSETDHLGQRRGLENNIDMDFMEIGVEGTRIASEPSQIRIFEKNC
jgi:hypothetical protein